MFFVKMISAEGQPLNRVLNVGSEEDAREEFNKMPISGRVVRLELWFFSDMLDARDA